MSRRSARSRTFSDKEEEDISNYGAEPEDGLEEEEEDEDGEQEVTRCICGQDELGNDSINPNLSSLLSHEYNIKVDQGLFIQCDKCSVWQHGYCVGLFINEDVPDKYWCELCKPDLHVFVYEHNERVRTLYKPVNDKRKKLQLENVDGRDIPGNSTRSRSSKRLTPSSSGASHNERKDSNENAQKHRKERRHYDDNYDEQLQKAIRESAKESGINLSDAAKRESADASPEKKGFVAPNSKSRSKRRINKDDSDNESSSKKIKSEMERSESDLNDVDESNIDEAHDTTLSSKKKSRSKSRTKQPKKSSKRSTTPKPDSKGSNSSNDGSSSSNPPLSKDELINQNSKPRYVNDKSTIYELRKRTGAILEWLGRSQLELEEEKVSKIELFDYKEKPDNETEQRILIEQNSKIVSNFNENLSLMEKLTESILIWEQKFGKYAP